MESSEEEEGRKEEEKEEVSEDTLREESWRKPLKCMDRSEEDKTGRECLLH